MADDKAIMVWAWWDAPEELRALSKNGGDEDWVALLPPLHAADPPYWMEDGSRFGCFSVDLYDHPTLSGWRVAIGAHA